MAYMNSEKKAQLAPAIKAVLKKYNMKGSLRVRNHSTLILTVTEGPIDFVRECDESAHRNGEIRVNPYWINSHFRGESLSFLTEVRSAMSVGNHNRSDIQSDYFDVGWYVEIGIGAWDKPYKLTGGAK